MMIVCVVLGLWGIWDYVVSIPEAARGAARADILRVIKVGLDTPNGSSQRLDAITLIDVALQSEGYADGDWDAGLAQMKVALEGASIEIQRKAMGSVEEGLNAYGNITAPSKYDRPMQWVFMSCLPFGLWYLLSYMKMKKRASMYELDDDLNGFQKLQRLASLGLLKSLLKDGSQLNLMIMCIKICTSLLGHSHTNFIPMTGRRLQGV